MESYLFQSPKDLKICQFPITNTLICGGRHRNPIYQLCSKHRKLMVQTLLNAQTIKPAKKVITVPVQQIYYPEKIKKLEPKMSAAVEALGQYVWPVGKKHKGKFLINVARDKGYVKWVAAQVLEGSDSDCFTKLMEFVAARKTI